MKILHVIPYIAPRYGGPPKVVIELSRALVEKGHKVSIFTTNIDGDKNLKVPLNRPVYNDGVEMRYYKVNFSRYWKFSWNLWKSLRQEIRKFDIVHIHSIYLFPTFITSYYCRKFNIPYLIRPHGTLDPFLLRRHTFRKKVYTFLFEKKNLNNTSIIHYTSEQEMKLAESYLSTIDVKTKGIIVPVGISIKDYEDLPTPGSFRGQYNIKNKKIVLFLGRLNFKKGIDILIKAFGKVKQKINNIHLVIVGPDQDKYSIQVRKWIKNEKIENSVTLTGMLLGKQKLAALKDADIFVLPSYTENLGLSLVEAMACELPVIISNRVNIYEEIQKYNAGIIINCDAEELANAIIHLYNNPQLREEMGISGRKLVEEKYTWGKIVEQTIKCYKKIIEKIR